MIKGFEVTCQIVWLSSLSSSASTSFSLLIKKQQLSLQATTPRKRVALRKWQKRPQKVCLDRVSKRAGDIICNTVLLSPSLEWFPGNFKQMDLVLQREISLFATKKRKLCSSTWAFSFYSLLLPLVIQEPLKGIKAELQQRVFSFPPYDSMTHFPTDLIFIACEGRGKKMQGNLGKIRRAQQQS